MRDLETYVGEALDRMGVRKGSRAHMMLLEDGVRSAYRLERALPPETSLRAILDEVLPQRLIAGMRHAVAAERPASAVA